MQKRIPVSYENFDRTHCAQCVLRGILEYFEPEKSWTWEELDEFTGKEPGKWTWPLRTEINMVKRGYEAIWTVGSHLKDYVEMGAYDAMVKYLGREAADIQRAHADLEKVDNDIQEYWQLMQENKVNRIERVPTLQDMRDYLAGGYLLACALNPYKLRNMEGYTSHLLLVYDIDDTHVHFHDSGLPMIISDKVEIDHFIAACTDPTPEQWALYAYKLGDII